MNKMMKQLSLAALMVAGVVGGAHAAAVSAVATDTQDVIIGDTGTASIAITPVTGLVAGSAADKTKLADFTATVTSGVMAVRWNPVAMKPASGADFAAAPESAKATGKNTSTELVVYLGSGSGVITDADFSKSASTPGWLYKKDTAKTYTAQIGVSGAQTIAADSYPLSLDAAVWVE